MQDFVNCKVQGHCSHSMRPSPNHFGLLFSFCGGFVCCHLFRPSLVCLHFSANYFMPWLHVEHTLNIML